MSADHGAELVQMRWGIQYPSRATPIINVRGETVGKKFKGAFMHHRCLMLVTGFYEWKSRASVACLTTSR
jgi:putative SOS response-associated peptidase YedK